VKNNRFQKESSLFVGASVRLGVRLALLLLAAPSSPAADNTDHEGLVGTWVTSATLEIVPPGFPSSTFQAVETFSSDGTMNVVSQIYGVTIGAGVWKQTGRGRFTFTFTFYRFDSPTTLMLPVQVQENVKMIDEDNYETTDVILPLDASGNHLSCPNPPFPGGICAFPGHVTAKRYQFANFNTVLP